MALYRCGSSGGTEPTVVTGSFSAKTASQVTIELGFKPSFVLCIGSADSSSYFTFINTVLSNSAYYNSSGTIKRVALPNTTSNCLASVTDTGFIMNKVASARSYTYYAYE